MSFDDIFLEIVCFYVFYVFYILSSEVYCIFNLFNEEFIVDVNEVIIEGCILFKIKKIDIIFWVVVLLYIFNYVII